MSIASAQLLNSVHAQTDLVCPLCTSRENDVVDAEVRAYRCRRCKHEYTVLSGEMGKKYDSHYFQKEHERWFQHPNIRLFRSIMKTVARYTDNRHITFLDVGCGNGDLLKFARGYRKNISLAGVDVAKLFDEPDIRFIQGDFNTVRFAEPFDVISSLYTIEHIDDVASFCARLHDAVKSGGLAVVCTVDSGSLIYRVARLLKNVGFRASFVRLYDHAHLHHFTKNSLSGFLRNAGFHVVSQKNHDFPMAALDVPEGGALMRTMYRAEVFVLFCLDAIFKTGMMQTVVCQRLTN